ncbi:MAG: hypothetical protein QXK07_04870, partial [Desulfurococcaceae archaeon]
KLRCRSFAGFKHVSELGICANQNAFNKLTGEKDPAKAVNLDKNSKKPYPLKLCRLRASGRRLVQI